MRVAAINDLSGLGNCSLLADIGVMSALGIDVCPVPTAVLTAQTGFPSYHMQDTGDMVKHSAKEWSGMGIDFDGILTGYIPYDAIADDIYAFVQTFRKDNTLILIDPVMGDNGLCYSNYTPQMLEKIKKLVSLADIITPNLTELCLLAGVDAKQLIAQIKTEKDLQTVASLCDRVRGNAGQTVIVTGMSVETESIYNIVSTAGAYECIGCSSNGESYSGTGDLFAASLMANVLNGKPVNEAVRATVEFIGRAIAQTKQTDRNFGVNFEAVLKEREEEKNGKTIGKNK